MIIPIDTDICNQWGISPNDFCLLYIISKSTEYNVEKMKLQRSKDSLAVLISKSLVKVDGNIAKLMNAARAVLEPDLNEMWAELVEKYPAVVTDASSGSKRVLHAQDPKAESNKKSRSKYLKVIEQNPLLHKKIMAALETQLASSFNHYYLPALDTWVNNFEWEKYFEIEPRVSATSKGKAGYGTDLR